MLGKTVEKNGTDWDQRLPYVLFAYKSSLQLSTNESPFFLLYGRDPRLSTEDALCPGVVPTEGVRNRGATGVWRGRLRSREKCPAGDAGAEGGEM